MSEATKRCGVCEGPEHEARRGHVFGSAAQAAWLAQGINPDTKQRAMPTGGRGGRKAKLPRRPGK